MLNLSIEELLKIIPSILIGLTVHEFAHSFLALKLGDDTAKTMGRLTLNPIKHIDPVGFVFLIIAGFGWAKPVVINRQKLRRPIRDDIFIALAGPFANLILALVFTVILGLICLGGRSMAAKTFDMIFSIFWVFILINIGLGLFNLIPIPPLDGSHLILNLLPQKSHAASVRIFRYGSIILLLLIVANRFTDVDIFPLGRLIELVGREYLKIAALLCSG